MRAAATYMFVRNFSAILNNVYQSHCMTATQTEILIKPVYNGTCLSCLIREPFFIC